MSVARRTHVAFLLLCILIAAATAFLVAKSVAGDDITTDVSSSLPPVAIDQRATASLEEQTIVPIVSANGTVMRYGSTWVLEAPATSDDITYRLLDPPVAVRAQIHGGPSGFLCAWAGLGQAGVPGTVAHASEGPHHAGATPAALVTRSSTLAFSPRALAVVNPTTGASEPSASMQASGRAMQPSSSGVTLRCEIPDDVRVAPGMTGTMVLQLDDPTTTEALPVTAVVGTAGQGQVVVVQDDGDTELRTVKLGVSDIYYIEITGGLAPTETVLQNPTQSDFAQSDNAS